METIYPNMKKILVAAICLSLFAFIKFDPFDDFLKKIETYVQEHPQEKAYLHLDKPYYAVGEDIWFKAYVTDTRSDKLSTLSSVLYVELIDAADSIKTQLKLPLVNGLSFGDFKLGDSIPEGNYRIRAYTQLMRNLGPDYFYDKACLRTS